jgi:hypothetical protein
MRVEDSSYLILRDGSYFKLLESSYLKLKLIKLANKRELLKIAKITGQ